MTWLYTAPGVYVVRASRALVRRARLDALASELAAGASSRHQDGREGQGRPNDPPEGQEPAQGRVGSKP